MIIFSADAPEATATATPGTGVGSPVTGTASGAATASATRTATATGTAAARVTSTGAALRQFQTRTDDRGRFRISLLDLPPGPYNVYVKPAHALPILLLNVDASLGEIDFGAAFEGDVDADGDGDADEDPDRDRHRDSDGHAGTDADPGSIPATRVSGRRADRGAEWTEDRCAGRRAPRGLRHRVRAAQCHRPDRV